MSAEAPIFTAEYERELEIWLRRRLGWLLIVTMVLSLLGLALVALQIWLLRMEPGRLELEGSWAGPIITLVSTLLTIGLAAWFQWRVRPALHSHEELVRAAGRFVLLSGLFTLATDVASRIWMPGVDTSGFGALALLYFMACMFLPWTVRESLRPMWPLLVVYAASQFLYVALGTGGDAAVQVDTDGTLTEASSRWIEAGVASVFAPLGLLPGLAVCWLRLWMHRRRFRKRMVHSGFFSMRRELSQARAVLGALFPADVSVPGVSFAFRHVPADEVGGDYLHASIAPDGSLRIVQVDVSGHGLAAAMTVARLSGEIDRIVAAQPSIGPGELLQRLNAYCLLTLSRHGIHATAAALLLDPDSGSIRHASAGHPPLYVRGVDACVRRLDSTTLLLGAMSDEDFGSAEETMQLRTGDTLFMLTDGLFEARNRRGEQFGLQRLRASLERAEDPADWAGHLVDVVQGWRDRMADDDLLVATIRWQGAAVPGSRRTGSGSLTVGAVA
ncbi:MAG: hypothetical protein EBQ99_03025 [Planctomycetes bacterium]|nr:hypothetical protein [Planctomycetota bacterium]